MNIDPSLLLRQRIFKTAVFCIYLLKVIPLVTRVSCLFEERSTNITDYMLN